MASSLHATVLPHRRKAIVFNSTGMPSQFNYMYGMASELAARQTHAELDVYFMTDNSRKTLIESTKGLKFLDLGPKDEVQADLSYIMSNARSRPRDTAALARITHLFWENPDVIMNNIHRCLEHLRELRPMLVVLDQFSRALDAAMALRIPYLMCGNETTPTSKPTDRSFLQAFFTVPSMCTGFVGPMTWSQTWSNCSSALLYVVRLLLDSRVRAQAAQRRREVDPLLPFATLDRSYSLDLEHGEIWAFPSMILHPHCEYGTVFPVGPTCKSDDEERTSLEPWLDEMPTVYINMGTLFKYTDSDLHVFGAALEDLTSRPTRKTKSRKSLITSDTHRFLWKLSHDEFQRLIFLRPGFAARTFSSQSSEKAGEKQTCNKEARIRVEHYIDSPSAVLQHPNTLAIVHHGGANSFAEAGLHAVPQMILPMWADCYDTAAQLERHGMGVSNLQGVDPQPPNLTVPLITGLINKLLSSEDHPSRAFGDKMIPQHGQSVGYAYYKEHSERFAEACKLAGGATRAAEIIESIYAKELVHWDGPGETTT